MLQLIAFIIFLASVSGIFFILAKKTPTLATLPKNGHHGFKKHKLILQIEKRVKDFHFDFFHKQIYLHRFLSKTRIWLLKLERKIGELLHGIRKKAQELDKEIKKKK